MPLCKLVQMSLIHDMAFHFNNVKNKLSEYSSLLSKESFVFPVTCAVRLTVDFSHSRERKESTGVRNNINRGCVLSKCLSTCQKQRDSEPACTMPHTEATK